METRGKGSVLATKTVEIQGKGKDTTRTGSVLATKVVKTQGKGSDVPVHRLLFRQLHRFDFRILHAPNGGSLSAGQHGLRLVSLLCPSLGSPLFFQISDFSPVSGPLAAGPSTAGMLQKSPKQHSATASDRK